MFEFIFKLFDYSRSSNSEYICSDYSSDSSINLISYIVWRRKGYQLFEEPCGTSVIKVKGIGKVSIGYPKMYQSG